MLYLCVIHHLKGLFRLCMEQDSTGFVGRIIKLFVLHIETPRSFYHFHGNTRRDPNFGYLKA